MKVGKIRPYSPAEAAGLKSCDYIWQINGKEVFELNHKDCVDEIKRSENERIQNLLNRRFEEEELDPDEYLARLTGEELRD